MLALCVPAFAYDVTRVTGLNLRLRGWHKNVFMNPEFWQITDKFFGNRYFIRASTSAQRGLPVFLSLHICCVVFDICSFRFEPLSSCCNSEKLWKMSETLPFSVEYAKSGRARCQGCKNPIENASLRIAKVVQVSFSRKKIDFEPRKNHKLLFCQINFDFHYFSKQFSNLLLLTILAASRPLFTKQMLPLSWYWGSGQFKNLIFHIPRYAIAINDLNNVQITYLFPRNYFSITQRDSLFLHFERLGKNPFR